MTAFQERVRAAVADEHLHEAIERATSTLQERRADALASLEHVEEYRDRARRAKLETLADLDQHLERFETRLTENGAKVHWARDGAEAQELVRRIARANDVRHVVKAKSMVSEEIHLNAALEGDGIEVLETDLGEYIAQLAGHTPSHIILPIIHMTKEDVGQVMHEKVDVPYTDVPAEITKEARRLLRANFLRADMGISGANFGVADTGTLCVVSNEGNIRMTTTLPRVHVAILGIEKLVPSLADLDRMLKVLARSATGQKITVYTSLINGPRRGPEDDGPDQLHVILLDNGRTSTLAGEAAEILACIRCGACLNVCPVFKSIGGHAYGDTYPGPMGSILTPALRGLEPWQELPQASSLCGACRDVCPLRIDIPRMLLRYRAQSAQAGDAPAVMKWFLRAFAMAGTRPWLFRLGSWFMGIVLRGRATEGWVRRGPGMLANWTRSRDFKAPASQSFQDWWARREGRRS